MIVVGRLSAYPRTIDFAKFREIADAVGALMMVDMAHIAGLVAAGVHPSPVPLADIVTTTTHKTLRGPRGGLILCKEAVRQGASTARSSPASRAGPLMHVIAAKAVAFGEALQPEFKAYQQQIVTNAKALAEALKGAGFRLCSGGTDNHLMLVDLRPKKLTGKVAEDALGKAGITVNKNRSRSTPRSRWSTSGVRVGTPAVTTRGMKEAEMAVGRRAHRRGAGRRADDAAAGAGPRPGEGAGSPVPALRLAADVEPVRHALPLLPGRREQGASTRASRTRARSSAGGASASTCKRRFTTYERVEELTPLIVKKDGRREAFDREKLLARAEEGLREAAGVGGRSWRSW